MSRCAVSGTELAVCMDKIEVLQVYNAVNAYFKGKNKRTEIITVSEKVPMEKPPMITKTNKATLAMIVLNEGKYLPRLMDNLFAHPSIKRIVAIDGGSEDNTVEILKKAGAEVFVHPWNFNYHDQVALQRNIMASYIPEEERFFYMDADEICSKDLLARLNEILGMPNRYICLSRRTFKNYNGAVKYFNILDRTKQHLNYPDYQPRIYTNDRYLKFFRSPHHLTLNIGDPLNVDADILHYERDEQEKNKARDKQWNNFMDMGRKLGLGSWYTDHTQNRRK